MLAQNGIVVIPKVKVEHMTGVKIALKIDKIVESVRDIYSYTEKLIIRQLKEIVSSTYRSIIQLFIERPVKLIDQS